MYFVYIIQSKNDRSFYIGVTMSLRERIRQHNWHETKSTASKTPYELVWFSGFKNKHKALSFEKYLKSSSGHAFRNKHLI